MKTLLLVIIVVLLLIVISLIMWIIIDKYLNEIYNSNQCKSTDLDLAIKNILNPGYPAMGIFAWMMGKGEELELVNRATSVVVAIVSQAYTQPRSMEMKSFLVLLDSSST